MVLNFNELKDFNIDHLSKYITRDKLVNDFLDRDNNDTFKQHYKLLAYISTKISECTIADVGTFRGLSALALSNNMANNIISYDIKNYREVLAKANITYVIESWEDNITSICNSGLIFFDAGSYNPEQSSNNILNEQMFYEMLIAADYKGVVIFDDLFMSSVSRSFLESVKIKTYNISKYGHMYSRSFSRDRWPMRLVKCGTHLIDFSCQVCILP